MEMAVLCRARNGDWTYLKQESARWAEDEETRPAVLTAVAARHAAMQFDSLPGDKSWIFCVMHHEGLGVDEWVAGGRDRWATSRHSGWPCRSMSTLQDDLWLCGSSLTDWHNSYGRLSDYVPNSMLGGVLRRDLLLPAQPIWRGCILNSLFYAFVLALITCFPTATVRAVRRFQRRCTACGYSTLGLPPSRPCPECGSSHRARAGRELPS